MNRPLIGLDFDDVLLHCFKHLIEFHNERYGTEHRFEEYTSYQPTTLWNCDYTEVMRRVKEYHESEHAKNVEPIEGAIEAIHELSETYDLAIVTMRPPETEAVTRMLLEQFPPVFKEVHFIGSWDGLPGNKNKADVCKELGAVLFIDDSLHNAEIISAAGIPVLLFDSNWNQADSLPDNVKRIFSWGNALEEIRAGY